MVSGQNVTLVAGLVLAGLLGLLGRRRATVAAMAAVAVYALLAGAEPPVQRGAIMGLLFLLATLLGRQSSAHVSLLGAAALMTALSPRLIQDVSFQLSFAATAGLVLLAPPLGRLLSRGDDAPGGLLGGLGGTLAMTLAAIAFTHPLIALYFDRLSLVAPLTNLLVVPLFPLLLATTALAALAGAVAAPLAGPLGWLAWGPLSYMLGVARLGAQMPFAALAVEGFGRLQAALAYGLVLAALVYLARRRPSLSTRPTRAFGPSRPLPHLRLPSPPPRPPAWALALLTAAALAVWLLILTPGGGRLTVSFLDVGQGDAILIESPGGYRVLVDGGPSGQALLGALDGRLPLWDRRLDLVALTHPQEDHMGGLVAALARYRVGAVMDNGGRGGSEAFLAYQRLRQEGGRRHIQAQAGQEVELGGGAKLSVLHPPGPQADDDNNGSLVLRVSLGEVSFLLTGDIEEPAEGSLLAAGRPLGATVLKVAHHGAATSSSPAFLAAVRPALAVISVGQDNSYGHPAPVALQRLDAALRRRLVLRTDRQGTVELTTDGRRLWLRSRHPLCPRAGGCR